MRHFTVFALLAALLCAFTFTSNADHRNRKALVTLTNFQRAGNTYSFLVLARNTNDDVCIGVDNSQFLIHYNSFGLSNPTLTNKLAKFSTGHYSMNVSTISDSRIIAPIRITISFNGEHEAILSRTNDTLCTVNMTITNSSSNADVYPDPYDGIVTTCAFNFEQHIVSTTLRGIDDSPLPIQLASFTGRYYPTGDSICLNWLTLTETNNYGFFVERRLANATYWDTLGFVPGHGRTNEPQSYTFTDFSVPYNQIYNYRLNQIDLDGASHPTDFIEIATTLTSVSNTLAPAAFVMKQNYPNPFNPSTNIDFSLVKSGYVSLKVYNVLGQEVATLIEGNLESGPHTAMWNATNLTTGMYFAKLTSNNTTLLVKMNLVK